VNYKDVEGEMQEVRIRELIVQLKEQVKGLPVLETLVEQVDAAAEQMHDLLIDWEQYNSGPEKDAIRDELFDVLETLVDVFGRGIRAPAELWDAGRTAARRAELTVAGL